MEFFMEAPNIVMKFPMILFWIFGKVQLGSKLGIGLTQIWSPNLFNCLVEFDFAKSLWNASLELPGQICKIKNILFLPIWAITFKLEFWGVVVPL